MNTKLNEEKRNTENNNNNQMRKEELHKTANEIKRDNRNFRRFFL